MIYILYAKTYRPSHIGKRLLIAFGSEKKALKYMKKYPNPNYVLEPITFFK